MRDRSRLQVRRRVRIRQTCSCFRTTELSQLLNSAEVRAESWFQYGLLIRPLAPLDTPIPCPYGRARLARLPYAPNSSFTTPGPECLGATFVTRGCRSPSECARQLKYR